jgi:single-stranded-DNA-specific exonuclease
LVVGFKDGSGRGSARTTGGFDLHRALQGCQAHLVVSGGHAAAAGFTVRQEAMPAFRDAFVALAEAHAGSRSREEAPVAVDAVLDLRELDLGQVEELERLGPFGTSNPQPLLALPGLVTRATRIVGEGHLQLTVEREGAVIDAIAFGFGAEDPGVGARVDLVGHAEVDSFRGYRRPRLRVKQLLRPDS